MPTLSLVSKADISAAPRERRIAATARPARAANSVHNYMRRVHTYLRLLSRLFRRHRFAALSHPETPPDLDPRHGP